MSDSNPATNDFPTFMSSPPKRRQPFNIPKFEDPPLFSEYEQINKYIHKKFRSTVSSPDSDSSRSRHMIRKVKISGPADLPSSNPCSLIQQRRSVIVRRGDTSDTPATPVNPADTTTIEIEFENINSEDEAFDDYGENNDVLKLSLNVVELENIFTHEERKYFDHSLSQFVGSWRSIHFGEKIINMYVNFCQNKGMIPSKFISFQSSAKR